MDRRTFLGMLSAIPVPAGAALDSGSMDLQPITLRPGQPDRSIGDPEVQKSYYSEISQKLLNASNIRLKML